MLTVKTLWKALGSAGKDWQNFQRRRSKSREQQPGKGTEINHWASLAEAFNSEEWERKLEKTY